MTPPVRLDDMTLLTTDGASYPLATLAGRVTVVVLLRHLA